jgi:enamine deaminase RidA (YjgF/YER057c/UK114 family)
MSDHIRPINPPSLMKPVGYSHAWEVARGRIVFIAGQVAKNGASQLVGKGDLVAQFRQVCENLRTVVTAAGGQMTDIVKLTLYVIDVDDYKQRGREIGGVYREYFGKHFPAMTMVGARDLYDREDGCLIEIEGMAVIR